MIPNLYYFTNHEFVRGDHDWLPEMHPRLLVLLDTFRYRWDRKVEISPHVASLGRHLGPETLSDHNVDAHGAVLAADVIPLGMETRHQASEALNIARGLGFTSIGLYPDWSPAPGLHLGVRISRRPGDPALWGGLRIAGKQEYVSLNDALAEMPEMP